MKRLLFCGILFAFPVTYSLSAQSATIPSIINDVFWKTTSGSFIYSQGGGIFRFPDAQGKEHYYWYGVHYRGAETYLANPTGKVEGTGFSSVTCYQSDDLVNWEFVGDVATSSSLGRAFWVGRLGVAYITEAKLYALLVQYNSSVLICTCSTPTGEFKRHNQIDMTNLIGTPNTGDQTVFTDPDTGKSYLVYSYGKGRNKVYLSEIGYRDEKVTLLDCHQIYQGSGREGNCMFKYKKKYYMCASDLYGWNASNVYYLEASDIYGPYTPTNNMALMPGAADDYGHVTQTGFFYTVRGTKEETVIYCGDRWADFAGNGIGYNQWCPISFENGTPTFNSLSHWHLNAETGEWRVGSTNNYVKNGSFEADRVTIPSGNKPVQDFLRGWITIVKKGNKVAVGSENSPKLNADNTAEDRQIVIGNKCLNISDKVPFIRQVYQKIASTPCVPIIDGTYTLKMKVKSSSQFSQLYVYAKSAGKTFKKDIHESDSKWHELTLEGIIVKKGGVEVGIMADAPAHAWCHIDDLELARNDNHSDRIPHNMM
ncbi:MAG: family 43 glycosylhydrolase [Bacteroidaceae bacterium]|nr:family 43 glycosylhydrolase [Bacteroidaceae bacterium]